MVSTSSPTLSGSITVAAEAGYSDGALKQVANDFMAQYPGTTVNVVSLGYGDALIKYVTAFQANQSIYDVLFVGDNGGYLGQLPSYLLNLAPYINNAAYFPASYNYSDIIPSQLSWFNVNGAVYALPYVADTNLFFYRPSFFVNGTNQQLFQQKYGYALPNPAQTTFTMQQLVDVASFFNGQHGAKYGIITMSGTGDDDMADSLLELFASARVAASATYGPVTAPYGDLFTSNGQLLTNSSEFRTTLSAYVQLVKASEDPLSAGFDTVSSLFASGDAPMMVFWSFPALTLSNSSIAHDWAVAPTVPGGVSEDSGEGLAVFKYTHNMPLAVAFTEFATSPSESYRYITLNDLMPFRYSGFAYEAQQHLLSSELVGVELNTLKNSVQGVSNVPYWPQISTYIRGEVPSIVSGSVTVAQGCSIITSESVQAGATAYTGG